MVGNCVTAVYSFSIGEKKCISRDFLQKKTEDRREGKLCHFCGHITPPTQFPIELKISGASLCLLCQCSVSLPWGEA